MLKFLFRDKVNVEINNTFKPVNSIDINNANTNNINANTNTNTNAQSTFISYFNNMQNITQTLLNDIKNFYQKIKAFYSKNKKYIIPASIIACYANINFYLKTGNNYIIDQTLWSNWQPINNCQNLEQISQIDSSKLIRLLLIEIQKRYINYNEPLNFLSPISMFIKKIEKEKNSLTFYSKFYTFLQKTNLLKIFLVKTNNFPEIESKLNKLYFIRDKFYIWLATYKFENINLR